MSTQALPSAAMPADRFLSSFLAGLSGSTARNRDAYQCAIARLGEFLSPRAVSEATAHDVQAFLDYLVDRGLSGKSLAAYRTILLRWLDHVRSAAGGPSGARPPMARSGIVTDVRVPDSAEAPRRRPIPLPPVAPAFQAPPLMAVPAMSLVDADLLPEADFVKRASRPAGAGLTAARTEEVTPWAPEPVEGWTVAPVAKVVAHATSAALPAVSRAAAPMTSMPMSATPGVAKAPAMATPAALEERWGKGSIPLASGGDELQVTSLADEARSLAPTHAPSPGSSPKGAAVAAEDLTTSRWALRAGRVERSNLDLTAIRRMAEQGEIDEGNMIRKPGGDWMRAGAFAPLRPIFARARVVPRKPPKAEPPPRPMPELLAWLGACAGAMAGAAAWWLLAIVAGHELTPVIIAAGLLAGLAARVATGGGSRWSAAAAVTCTVASLVLGRYLVFSTGSSGAAPSSPPAPSTFAAFLVNDMTPVALACLLLAALMAMGTAGRARVAAAR